MDLQAQCELGQEQLTRMEYRQAERTLAAAEAIAWRERDFDTLSRLYMPLQEARRQIRQRCGEGVVCLDLIAQGPDDHISADHVMRHYPHGQLLVGGWGTIAPAVELRNLAAENGLYLETFLAAVYPVGGARAVAIVALEDAKLPPPGETTIDALLHQLPPNSILLHENELPEGSRRGSAETFAEVMGMWERLHAPYLAAADATADPVRRIEAYRQTIRVDYACELAHQKLSDTARQLKRQRPASRSEAV